MGYFKIERDCVSFKYEFISQLIIYGGEMKLCQVKFEHKQLCPRPGEIDHAATQNAGNKCVHM